MPLFVQCPNPDCKASSMVGETLSGRNVKCKRCGTPFTAKPTFDAQKGDTKKGKPASHANPFPTLPAEFGRYRILPQLGRGGMGAVYLAQDTQLGRQVALKVPFFDAAGSPQRAERFVREARSAAVLQHPNICTVYDAGQIDGRPFITMAYIAGTPLEKEIDPDAPMPQVRRGDRPQDRPGAATRPSYRNRSSRSEAGQRDDGGQRRASGHGFRPGQTRR